MTSTRKNEFVAFASDCLRAAGIDYDIETVEPVDTHAFGDAAVVSVEHARDRLGPIVTRLEDARERGDQRAAIEQLASELGNVLERLEEPNPVSASG